MRVGEGPSFTQLIEGETRPFSTCEMKLGEKSVRAASVRRDI
jgi:hypothetical protein